MSLLSPPQSLGFLVSLKSFSMAAFTLASANRGGRNAPANLTFFALENSLTSSIRINLDRTRNGTLTDIFWPFAIRTLAWNFGLVLV